MANTDAAPAAMTERELKRYTFRVGLFQRRGVPKAEAEALAERMRARDADLCELRMCIECSSLQHGNTCFAMTKAARDAAAKAGRPAPRGAHEVIPRQFFRCPHFTWATPA